MRKDIGLVLEGGAMRGLFTMGVLDVFMENGVIIPSVVGVSAGAAFGCNYKSGQIGRVLRYNLKYCGDKRYCSALSLLRTGDLYGAEFCYRTLPFELDPFDVEAYDISPMAFWVVATDVLTGKPVYRRLDVVDDDCMDWMRASASMPIVSRPVNVGGHVLLDGGMSDSIPLRFMEGQGCKRNVVILTQPRSYVKRPGSMLPYRAFLRKYPAMIKTMQNRPAMYRCQRDYVFAQEATGSVFVICPDEPLPIAHTEHDPLKIAYVYEIGRQTALRQLDALKAFVE